MNIIEDTRIPPSNEFHPNACKVGDLYKPWYFYKNAERGAPKNINQVCLVYRIERMQLNPNQIPGSSFLKIPREDDFDDYFSEPLAESIKTNGQQVPIVCTKHYTKDAPVDVEFLVDPTLEKIHCFEGHHRVVATMKLGMDVVADVYSLFHMDCPIDYSKYYHSIYDDTFWSSFQTPQNRKPWFTEESFTDLSKTYKYTNLQQCLNYVKSLNLEITNGIDVGCAEGSYTFYANSVLEIPMRGIDLEPGRIIRGLLMRAKHDRESVTFSVNKWTDDVDYSKYDFGMFLSILHHVDNPFEFMKTATVNKKAMIVEVRISNSIRTINSGTIKAINTKPFYEDMFNKLGFKYSHMSTLDDRAFYVCWR